MKSAEIRELTTKEIEERIQNETFLQNKTKLNHAVSPLENTNKLRETRKMIARLKTELRQRELKNQVK